MGVKYAYCWEDHELLNDALEVKETDVVLSICSGGENVLALALKNPKKIVAIDENPHQLQLFRLKLAGIKALSHKEFLVLMGFYSGNRVKLYEKTKKYLPPITEKYWNARLNLIKKGLFNTGKFENYLGIFRKIILPLVFDKRTLQKYFSGDINAIRKEFTKKRWNLLFKIFFSKTVMRLGRSNDRLKDAKNVANNFKQKAENGLLTLNPVVNEYTQLILKGKPTSVVSSHPYINKNNYYKLRSVIQNIVLVKGRIPDYLGSHKFDKYNLSNIFETMTQEQYENCMKNISENANNNSTICYWNNQIPRYKHDVDGLRKVSTFLKDRVFFYDRFVVEEFSA